MLRLLLAAILLISGCTGKVKPVPPEMANLQSAELTGTPFYAQEKYQCGPASLAMLLGASGIRVHPDQLKPLMYIPARKGSLQLELTSAARQYGRIPYRISPDLPSLSKMVRSGRPVLVLQNLGLKIWPIYHYAVVIGILRDNTVVLRSGTDYRLEMTATDFWRTWYLADFWGMVVLRPGELPDHAEPERFVDAVTALERVGEISVVSKSLQAALDRWPDHPLVLFAYANSCLSLKDWEQAQSIYRKLLAIEPNHIGAANNLADTLVKIGCYRQANRLILKTLEKADQMGSPLLPIVRQTHLEILSLLKSHPRFSEGDFCLPLESEY
ncbi:MAG: PA2778 family cysteine peptidase [Desulfotignum sp.]|nr:PA2778 family cysteine peptidase [Desulfotignum sp.]